MSEDKKNLIDSILKSSSDAERVKDINDIILNEYLVKTTDSIS